MYKDSITEELHGDGAIRVAARVMLQRQGKNCKGLDETLMLGVTISPDTPFTKRIKGHEMWECEMILIPKRKLRSEKTHGWLAEDMLTTALGDSSLWTEVSQSKKARAND